MTPRSQTLEIRRYNTVFCIYRLCHNTTCRPVPWQSTARGWPTTDRVARNSTGIRMANPRLWTASCYINRHGNCSADSPRAAPDCMTYCGSRPDCSCSSMESKDLRVVHLQHGSMRCRSFMRSPSTARKR